MDHQLPEWYTAHPSSSGHTTAAASNRRYLRKGLKSLGEVLLSDFAKPVCGQSPYAQINPCVKILSVALLVMVCTLIHSISALAVLFAILVVLLALIKMPLKFILRIWLGVPLLSLAIILPAITNVITPGHAIFRLFQLELPLWTQTWQFPSVVTITHEGLVVASRFLLRSIDCVTVCVLLVASTESSVLLHTLRRMGMPKLFGMVLSMCYRYIAVLVKASEEIHLAKLSRSIGANSIHTEHKWVAASLGILFRKTHKMATEVHHAMISRGYDGDIHTLSKHKYTSRDFWCVMLTLLIASLLFYIEYSNIWTIS